MLLIFIFEGLPNTQYANKIAFVVDNTPLPTDPKFWKQKIDPNSKQPYSFTFSVQNTLSECRKIRIQQDNFVKTIDPYTAGVAVTGIGNVIHGYSVDLEDMANAIQKEGYYIVNSQ